MAPPSPRCAASCGKRVAANSVYRILDLFVTNNIAMRVESANAYVANDHPDCLHDCIFLICDQFGQTTHLDDDSLSGGVRAAAQKAGFAPERPVIVQAPSSVKVTQSPWRHTPGKCSK